MTAHSTRASTALKTLTEDDPAMAALSLWCLHRDREQTPAAITEGETIHYGPAFAALPRHEQAGLAAHHILHAALRHGARMGAMADRMGEAFDEALWGIAADAIVNEALLLAGYALPRPALRLTGVLQAALGQVVPPRQALAEWDADRLYLRLRAGGAGAEGAAQKARDHAAAQGFSPDLERAPGGPGKDAPEDADWRQHLARAMEAGRIAGRGIGAVAAGMADLPSPRIPWEVILRNRLARALLPLPRPSHRRPSHAFLAMEARARAEGGPVPVFQPGIARSSPAPRLVLALDTSSSIDDDRMGLFLAEVTGAVRRMGAEVWLIPFDEAPEPPQRLDPGTLRALGLPGAFRRGGGTAFAPALRAAATLAPSLIVVLTDLEGDPGPDPGCPVLWAVPDEPAQAPGFGQVLAMAR
ncbi:MAG: DUF2201 family putative metallopeptidase [Gemmobacter sp.]